jgi:hypothetical protein
MTRSCSPNEPTLVQLVRAADDALAAYRAIFGRSCWNGRDREAFRRLDSAIGAAIENACQPRREPLSARLRRRGRARGDCDSRDSCER